MGSFGVIVITVSGALPIEYEVKLQFFGGVIFFNYSSDFDEIRIRLLSSYNWLMICEVPDSIWPSSSAYS